MKLALTLAITFIVATIIVWFLGRVPYWVPLTYVVGSVVTFAAYGLDKSKAQSGAWRTPEKTLHSLELFGGWPGAIVAQQYFRHKNRKVPFLIVCWAIVALHFAGWVAYFAGLLPGALGSYQ